MFNEGLIVFSKSICPNCVTVKRKLEVLGQQYSEICVDEDPEALNFLKGKGFRSVPVVMLDGNVIVVS